MHTLWYNCFSLRNLEEIGSLSYFDLTKNLGLGSSKTNSENWNDLDTEPLYTLAISKICEKYGSEFTPEAKTKAMGRTALEAAKSVIESCNLPITPEQYVKELDEQYETVFAHVKYMPGAESLINYLHASGFPQAIATSSTRDGYLLKSKDQQESFNRLFEHILTASSDPEVKEGKPAPDSFLVAAKRFKNPPLSMKNVSLELKQTRNLVI